MNISGTKIFQYSLPLRQPFVIARREFVRREGIILELITDEGCVGIGEIAPLPGLSSELLKESLYQIRSLRTQLGDFPIPENIEGLKDFFLMKLFDVAVPSVRFGVEMAVIHALAQKKNCTAAEVMGCADTSDLQTAGLLQGTIDEVKSRAQALARQGYKVFKLKVGSKNIPLDVKKVEAVQSVIGRGSLLRLDINRAWNLDEATAFVANIDHSGIEFMEEPLNDINDLPRFSRATRMPIALDESLWMFSPQKFIFFESVEFLILKPMIMGGIGKSLEWIDLAKSKGKRVVISSSFESGAGRLMLANLALLTSSAAGLGTGDWLQEDLFFRPFVEPNGVILKGSLKFAFEDIAMSYLTEIKS